jgi:AraC family transcriptional regulator of adaptative response / DNA-3-methyladenine glycosylase II
VRQNRDMTPPVEIDALLPVEGPLDVSSLRRFLDAHVVAGLDVVDHAAGTTTRSLDGPHGPAVATISWPDEVHDSGVSAEAASPGTLESALKIHLQLSRGDDLDAVVALLRRWLDLDADSERIAAELGRDERLGPLVAARPGLRIPGSVNGAETALFTVLGQQVSLAAARTFQGRLVAAVSPVNAWGFRSSPDPAAIADAHTEDLRAALGITRSRVAALQALARVLADGLELAPHVDHADARRRLLAVKGIGPWTADYVALRCLRDDDAFPSGDLILRRALGATTPAEAIRLAEPWRPWRGYATLHLWTAAVFVDAQQPADALPPA